jgi:hypothetical protein
MAWVCKNRPTANFVSPILTVFFLLFLAGSIHTSRRIDYVLEENRVLRGDRFPAIALTDEQRRRRLAAKGHILGQRHLATVAGIVTGNVRPTLKSCETTMHD